TTAHAMAGDRERCLAAGMNGYVSKPLRPEALEQVIEEGTRSEEEKPNDEAMQQASPLGAPLTPFDREDFLDRMMGNEDMARQIIRGFVDDMPRQLASLA